MQVCDHDSLARRQAFAIVTGRPCVSSAGVGSRAGLSSRRKQEGDPVTEHEKLTTQDPFDAVLLVVASVVTMFRGGLGHRQNEAVQGARPSRARKA